MFPPSLLTNQDVTRERVLAVREEIPFASFSFKKSNIRKKTANFILPKSAINSYKKTKKEMLIITKNFPHRAHDYDFQHFLLFLTILSVINTFYYKNKQICFIFEKHTSFGLT